MTSERYHDAVVGGEGWGGEIDSAVGVLGEEVGLKRSFDELVGADATADDKGLGASVGYGGTGFLKEGGGDCVFEVSRYGCSLIVGQFFIGYRVPHRGF